MKNLICLFVLCLFFYACADDSNLIEGQVENQKQEISDISVSDQGFVCFKTRKVFDDYFSKLGDDKDVTRASSAFQRIDGFRSLKDMKEMCLTRSENDDNDEEGNEDEYRVACCSELLPDSRMENFLDTTMTVAVADTLYKITDIGTFFTKGGSVADMINAIRSFKKENVVNIGTNCYQVDDDVFVYDTFGKISGDTVTFDKLDETVGLDGTRASSSISTDEGENTSVYGLSSYKWRTNSWGLLTTFFGFLGTDCTKTNNFDKKHRVACHLYKVDYKFVETCGFSVKMQRRKKFWFIPYWVSCSADNLVVGIEEFHSRTTLKNDFNHSPLYIEDKGHYVDQSFDYVNNMIYAGCFSVPFLSDWLDKNFPWINTVYAGIKRYDNLNLFRKNPWAYTDKLQKKAIYSGLGRIENLIGKNIVKNRVAVKGTMALVFNGVGTMEHYIRGINAFDGNSKTITFSSSGGISVSMGGGKTNVSPFNTEDFDLLGIKIFGAVNYEGKWKGIRIYKEEKE